MDPTTTKFLITVVIFLISLFSALLPLKVINFDEHLFSVGNLLASGILLAGGLVHQLPDSIENLHQTWPLIDFPVAPFLAGLTFVLFLILEEYLHTRCDKLFSGYEYDHHDHHGHHHQGHEQDSNTINKHNNDYGSTKEVVGVQIYIHDGVHSDHNHNENHTYHHQHQHGELKEGEQKHMEHMEEGQSVKEVSALLPYETRKVIVDKRCRRHDHDTCDSNHIDFDQGQDFAAGGDTAAKATEHYSHASHTHVLEALRSKTFAQEHPHHHHEDHVAEHMHGSLLASVILLCALSLHSILEGLAVGVSANPTEVWSVTIAIVAHKGFAGYALGSSMVASQMNERHLLVLAFVFAFCSILGIAMGMVFEQIVGGGVDNNNEDKDSQVNHSGGNAAIGIIQAMVAGTFLYVSIVEIGLKELLLCRESKLLGNKMCKKETAWSKLAAFFFGYVAMSGLAFFV